MNILRLMIVVLMFPSVVAFGQEINQMKEEKSLSEQQLAIFDSALLELKKRKENTLGYKASLYKLGDRHIVIFESPSSETNQRGSGAGEPAFEVEFNANAEIVRANFSR